MTTISTKTTVTVTNNWPFKINLFNFFKIDDDESDENFDQDQNSNQADINGSSFSSQNLNVYDISDTRIPGKLSSKDILGLRFKLFI